MKNKKFDAVKFMRKVRNELSQKYLNHPEMEKKDLEIIRKKYGLKNHKQLNSQYQIHN